MSHMMACDAYKGANRAREKKIRTKQIQSRTLLSVMNNRVESEQGGKAKTNAMSHIMVGDAQKGTSRAREKSGRPMQCHTLWSATKTEECKSYERKDKTNSNKTVPRCNFALRELLTETLRMLTELQWNG